MQGCFSFLRSMAPKAERTVTVHPTVPFLNKATKVHGALVFASGQLGMREPGKLVPGGVQAEADQALKNLADVLAEAGSDIRRCLKVNIFLADIADFNAFNEVYASGRPRTQMPTFFVLLVPGGIVNEFCDQIFIGKPLTSSTMKPSPRELLLRKLIWKMCSPLSPTLTIITID